MDGAPTLTVSRLRDIPRSSPHVLGEPGQDPRGDRGRVVRGAVQHFDRPSLGPQVHHGVDVETGLHVAVVLGPFEPAVPAACPEPVVDHGGVAVEDDREVRSVDAAVELPHRLGRQAVESLQDEEDAT